MGEIQATLHECLIALVGVELDLHDTYCSYVMLSGGSLLSLENGIEIAK